MDLSASTLWWLATGALVVLELTSATFYLLMLAAGTAAAALAAHAGLGVTAQIVIAAGVGGGATALLGGVLERVSGLSVPAFADAHLFGPLGITEARWITDLRGKALVFSGLRMRPRDLARIGRLLLDNGRVLEREVVPAAWIAQSFAPHVATGDGMAFGYHWWVNNGGGIRERWTAAFGNGGQRLYMVPALDLVVVMTAGRYNQSNHGRIAHELFRRIVAAARA